MHKFILWCFKNLENFGETFSFLCSFCIMATTLYWIESITNSQWNWLNFIKPLLDFVLNIANIILPFSVTFAGTVYDGKFVMAMLLLIILMCIVRYLLEKLERLKEKYDDLHISHKLAVQKAFNNEMIEKIKSEELQISKYMILVNTRIKKKFSHKEQNIDINEQNKLMNDFISEHLGVKFDEFSNGFLYLFDDFNKIDDTLDILFKVMNADTPIEYSISIQSGSDLKQLILLSELNLFGKIVFCADTLLRYKCNRIHGYGTHCIGVYQKEAGTIEVHEFYKIL